MSANTFHDADNDPVTIEGRADSDNWGMKFGPSYREFTPADAPALALAILEAAGINGHENRPTTSADLAAHYLRGSINETRKAVVDAARGKRRDELAREFTACGNDYQMVGAPAQAAIDRIIELEARP